MNTAAAGERRAEGSPHGGLLDDLGKECTYVITHNVSIYALSIAASKLTSEGVLTHAA